MTFIQFFWIILIGNSLYFLVDNTHRETAMPTHAVYISICEITYKDQGLDVYIKVFTNDLEDAIRNQTGEVIAVENNLQNPKVNQHIEKYLKSVVKFIASDTNLPLQYLESKKENDATWAHFSIPSINTFTQLTIQNKIFTELFESQLNVVTLKAGEEKKYLRLDKNKAEGKLSLD